MAAFSNESAWQWADILGYGMNQELLLAIELKPRLQAGATRMARRWFHELGQARPELYALFITSEFVALRLPAGRRRPEASITGLPRALREQLKEVLLDEIDYVVDAAATLDMAIDTHRVPLQKLDPPGLQRVVESWLDSCLATPAAKLKELPAQGWLVNSGLHQALQKGRILPPVGGPTMYAFAG